jgi:hypothetical protein
MNRPPLLIPTISYASALERLPVVVGRLTQLGATRTIRPGRYADGDRLYLIVVSATSKYWSYRYWNDAKERWLRLGSFKDLSLKNARLARDAARLRIKHKSRAPSVE